MTDQEKKTTEDVTKELNQKALSQIEKSLNDTIDDVISSFNTYLQTSRGKINERIVVGIILPFMAGKYTFDEIKDMGCGVKELCEMAGSPYKEMDVIDDQGNIIGVLPPIVYKGHLEPRNHAEIGRRLADVFVHRKELLKVNPRLARNYYYNELLKSAPVWDKVTYEQYIESWASIFVTYGYFDDIIPPGDAVKTEDTPTPLTELDDLVEDFE